LVILAILCFDARGQNSSNNEPPKSTGPSQPARTTEVEELRSRIDQLVLLVERQQQTLTEMQKKIKDIGAAKDLAGTASLKAETKGESARNESSTETKSVTQGQSKSIEERVQKVEEQVLKVGPIRFGGDFRFRFDTILRKATEPPEPALAHAQNARMRYRLRLNMDSDISPIVSFHGQLSTGPINNGLTNDQDFTSTVAHQPFFISEAWIDYHPMKTIQLQGGRVQEVFADNSRFLFDDDIRFNGFNERFTFGHGSTNLELRAAQYWFSNPNVGVITAGSPLARAGDEVGTIGRSSNLFHQGLLVNTTFNKRWSQQVGGDVQVFREPNQIQLASTADGVVFIVQPGLGLVLSGPMTGTGNATTTPGGAIYTAEDFHVARLTYRLNNAGFNWADHAYPIAFNIQVARNYGTDQRERDAMLAALQIGKPVKRGDMSFLYVFAIKGANSIISQLTDDDLGTNTGVNLRTHYFRWELGLAKKVTLQSLLFVQRELRNSGDFPNFFVPLGAFAPRQYRFQEHLVFSF
jgi:putative porin